MAQVSPEKMFEEIVVQSNQFESHEKAFQEVRLHSFFLSFVCLLFTKAGTFAVSSFCIASSVHIPPVQTNTFWLMQQLKQVVMSVDYT